MAFQKVLVGSMWAFEEIGLEELQNEFKAKYPEYDCVCEYSPDDHFVTIKSKSTECTRAFASFIIKFIEEKKDKDLLDLPRVVRLDNGLFHENKSYHSEPVQDSAELVDVSSDSGIVVPHPLSQFAKYWQSSKGDLGFFGSAELFTTPNFDVLKAIEKATGTIISINKDLKNIKVAGWNIGDVDDAIGKLTRVEFTLSVPRESRIGNVLITSHDSIGRIALRKYSTLNSAALRRVLTNVKPVSYIPLKEMFTSTFLPFDPIMYNYGKLENLVNPPSVSRIPSKHGNSRIWSDFTFKGFGSDVHFRSLEPASVENGSGGTVAPDTSLPQPDPPSTKSHQGDSVSDGFENGASAASHHSTKPEGPSGQPSGLLDPVFAHLVIRPIPDRKTQHVGKPRKPMPLFGDRDKPPTRPRPAPTSPKPVNDQVACPEEDIPPYSVPSSHTSIKEHVSDPKVDRPSQPGPSLFKSAENKALCHEEAYRRSYRAFIEKIGSAKENRPPQPSSSLSEANKAQVPSREEDYRQACRAFIDKVLSANKDRPSQSDPWLPKPIKEQTSHPDEGNQGPPRRIWRMKYDAPPAPEAAASDPAQQESVAGFDPDNIPIGILRASFNKFFDPTKYGHPLSVRQSKGKVFHRTMQQQAGKPGDKPVANEEKEAVREKAGQESKSAVPPTTVKQAPKDKESIYTNETIKSFFGVLKPGLDVAEYFQGSVNLEVQIGIVLIPRLPQSLEGSKITMNEWNRIFQPTTGVRAPTTKFVNRVTSYGSEVDHIVDLKIPRNGSMVRLFEQEYSESHVSYEYHCRTRTKQFFTIVINDDGGYSIEMAPTEIGAVNLHFPKHIWDACVKVNGTNEYASGANPALEADVKYLVDNAWVPAGSSRPQIFVRVAKENKFVVEKVFMKRWTRHRCTEHSKPRTADNDRGEGLFLQITEVHKLVTATSPADPQAMRAHSSRVSDIGKERRLWYEVSLVSSAIDTLLDSNKNLEVGERTEDWRANDLLGRYGTLLSSSSLLPPTLSPVAEAIGTAGLGDLLNLTRKVVEKMDGIGFWNRGPASSGRLPKSALTVVDSDKTVSSLLEARDKSEMMDASNVEATRTSSRGSIHGEPSHGGITSELPRANSSQRDCSRGSTS